MDRADLAPGKAVASFFTPLSKKEPDQISWNIISSTLLVGRYKPPHIDVKRVRAGKRKIVAFDLVSCKEQIVSSHIFILTIQDSTLIKTRSGNTFAKDANDWQWWNNIVPTALKGLAQDGRVQSHPESLSKADIHLASTSRSLQTRANSA